MNVTDPVKGAGHSGSPLHWLLMAKTIFSSAHPDALLQPDQQGAVEAFLNYNGCNQNS